MHTQRQWQPIANMLSLLFNTFNSWVQTLPMDAPAPPATNEPQLPTFQQLQAAYAEQQQRQAAENTFPKDNQLAAAAPEQTSGTPAPATKGKNKLAGSPG